MDTNEIIKDLLRLCKILAPNEIEETLLKYPEYQNAVKVLGQDDWISVEKELPPQLHSVLVIDSLQCYKIVWIDSPFGYSHIGWTDGKNWWSLESVTHWRLLPQPPKKEEEG